MPWLGIRGNGTLSHALSRKFRLVDIGVRAHTDVFRWFNTSSKCGSRAPIVQPSPANIAQPAAIGDGWEVTSLEAAGMDRRPIEAMTAEIRRYSDWNIHAVLIEREGRLVYEEYFAGEDQEWGQNLGPVVFTRDTKHDLRSITKSVTSALVGITLASGKIRSLDQLLLDFFPEHAAASGRREHPRISLRHALMMSAGLDWNEDLPYTDPRNDENVMTLSEDPMGYVLTRPGVAEPGAVWRYNGGLPQVLATIVQRATGERLRDYARRVLFAPLGITDFEWLGNLAGVPAAASGLRLRPRDLAKFGSLGRPRHRERIAPSCRPLGTATPKLPAGSGGYNDQTLASNRAAP